MQFKNENRNVKSSQFVMEYFHVERYVCFVCTVHVISFRKKSFTCCGQYILIEKLHMSQTRLEFKEFVFFFKPKMVILV